MDDDEKRRRAWFLNYVTQIKQGIIQAPQPGVMYVCPCCGYPTLQERGNYDICMLCDWEDDGQDDPHADAMWGDPDERYSLAEARENFKKNLVMYTIDPRIGGGDSQLEKQTKRSIITTFEKMRSETDTETLQELWDQVNEGRQILFQELERKIREHDEKHKK